MNLLKTSALFFALLLVTSQARAAVSILEKDDWKVQMSGFVETDIIHDSTRSQTEVVGNAPTARAGTTTDRNNGRTQMSMRNSRIAFSVMPPVQEDWKTKGYLEFDLLGFDPKPNNTAATDAKNSETSFFANPTMRVRHAYFNAEKNGWTYLMGQTWTLFGWQPSYVLTTASVPPGPGNLYQRTTQALAMKSLALTDTNKLQIAASLGRPSQRDSEMPNIDAGVRWSMSSWKGGFASPSGDVKAEPLSVGLSATFREFVTPKTATADSEMNKHHGQGLAANILVPILPATDEATAGSLTLTGEITGGTGYADEFTNWTGGLGQMNSANGATLATNTNLDAGQGGYEANNSFRLIRMRSWNAQLQYQLPGEMHSFVTLGYSKFDAMRVGSLTGGTYDGTSMMFANIFHDCTKQIRVAAEYAKFTTHYIDGQSDTDDRFQLNGYFRF